VHEPDAAFFSAYFMTARKASIVNWTGSRMGARSVLGLPVVVKVAPTGLRIYWIDKHGSFHESVSYRARSEIAPLLGRVKVKPEPNAARRKSKWCGFRGSNVPLHPS
jgi:hypothetical protein